MSETKQQRRPRVISMWRAARMIQPPDWLIKDVIEMDTLSAVFAPPASGKSMVAIDIACCIVTGTEWHGHKVKAGGVIYIAGEGSGGLKKRTRAWQIYNNIDDEDMPLLLCEHSINGQSKPDIQSLISEVEQQPSNIINTRVNLVIIDTVARNFGAGDENSASDMGAFIQNMDFIRKKWKCAVLLVHHTGHNDFNRARGSSAFRAALDAEYSVSKDDNLVEFKSTKMKDADEPAPIHFDLKPVDLGIIDDESQPVTSVVLDLTDKDISNDLNEQLSLSEKHKEAINLLNGMSVTNKNSDGPNNEPCMVDIEKFKRGCLKNKLTDASHWSRFVNALIQKGLIKRQGDNVFLVNH